MADAHAADSHPLLDNGHALDKRVGFIGSGQMAEALARGLLGHGILVPAQICCSDPSPARKELFRSFGTTPYESNVDVSACKRVEHK